MKRILLFFAFVFIFKCEIFSQYSDTAELRSDINNWIKPNANLTGTQLNKLLRGFLQFTKPNAATTQNLRDTSAEMRSLAAAFDTTLLGYLLKIDTVNGKQQFSVDSIALADLLATIGGSGTSWQLNGNAGLNFSTNFIGTTDAVNIKFKRNNVFAGMIASNENTSLGVLSNSSTSHFDNTAIGHGALQNSATDGSTAVGALALNSATTGSNTAVGYIAGQGITTGTENTIIGREAASRNITGSNNLFVGHYSDFAGSSTSISNSIAIGNSAKVGCNGCAVIGDSALNINTGFGRSYPAATVDIKGSLKFVDGNQSLGKVLTTDANGNATWQTSNARQPRPWFFVVPAQSNGQNQDITKGNWLFTPTPQIKVWNGSAFVTADPSINNIAFGDGLTADRNNLGLGYALTLLKEFPTDTVYFLVSAKGSRPSSEWTPKTSGAGEVTGANTMLTDLFTKLNATPSYFKPDLIIYQQGEQDDIAGNVPYWLNNVMEFYDTCAKSSKFAPGVKMLLNYPVYARGFGAYDSIAKAIDSVIFGKKDLAGRKIYGVGFDFPNITGDTSHYTNESLDLIGAKDYEVYRTNTSLREVLGDTAIIKKVPSGGVAIAQKLVVNGLASYAVGFPFDQQQSGSANLGAFSRTDGGLQSIRLSANTNDANILHYAIGTGGVATLKNAIRATDTIPFSAFDSTLVGAKMLVSNNTVQMNVPTTATSLLAKGGIRTNAASTFVTTATAAAQLIIATTGAATGNAARIDFDLGGTLANNGSLGAYIQAVHNGTGGALELGYSPNFSTRSRAMKINSDGNISIGDNSVPTTLLDIMPGNTTRAQIRLRGSVAPTSPNKGDIYFDSTSTGNNNAIIYDGTNSCKLFKGLSGSATLDFSSISAQTGSELTITVTGAADGDDVLVSPPNASFNAGVVYKARVSSSNTVSVTAYNITTGSIDPASGTFKVTVIKL